MCELIMQEIQVYVLISASKWVMNLISKFQYLHLNDSLTVVEITVLLNFRGNRM